jgi:hypothetical protein
MKVVVPNPREKRAKVVKGNKEEMRLAIAIFHTVGVNLPTKNGVMFKKKGWATENETVRVHFTLRILNVKGYQKAYHFKAV